MPGDAYGPAAVAAIEAEPAPQVPDDPQPRPTPVTDAVELDLAALPQMTVGTRRTMAEVARRLARAIDGWQEDVSSSGLSALARAVAELRATLDRLTGEVVTSDADDEFLARMSAAARHPAQPGAGDDRPGDS